MSKGGRDGLHRLHWRLLFGGYLKQLHGVLSAFIPNVQVTGQML